MKQKKSKFNKETLISALVLSSFELSELLKIAKLENHNPNELKKFILDIKLIIKTIKGRCKN